MLIKLGIFGLVFASVGLLVWQYSPLCAKRLGRYENKRVKESSKKLEAMFVTLPSRNLFLIHSLTPLVLGGLGFLVSGEMFVGLIAAAFGLVLPAIILKRMAGNRRNLFQTQLIDALMILSSSLKAGLSFLQSVEAVVEEMPAPISQEFALVLRENRLGIPLDESLEKLNKRIKSEELNLIVSAISVARETGGNLPEIFTQITYTLKEKAKLLAKVKTLTIQGKLQGTIMSCLPVVFTILVYSFNPQFFDIMMQEQLGQVLLGYAVVSQLIGIFLIMKFSKVEA